MLLSLVGVGQFDAVLSLAPALGITYYPTPFGLVSAAWVIAASAAAAVSLKSAQFLFFPWLLEAMEAPVPISAQLHSSTLVVIGLFLAFRFEAVLCSLSLGQPYVVLGAAATAALASILGFFQADVKKMLACSTASQLAYVCAAMGLGLWADALALLYVVCVGKAVIFVWFGALMATNGGVSDSRLIVFSQTSRSIRAGLLVAAAISTVGCGSALWHIKALLFRGGSTWALSLGIELLAVSWFFSSLYLAKLSWALCTSPALGSSAQPTSLGQNPKLGLLFSWLVLVSACLSYGPLALWAAAMWC